MFKKSRRGGWREPDWGRGRRRTFDLQDGASFLQGAPGHGVCKDTHPLKSWNASNSSWRLVRTGLFLSNCWETRTGKEKKGKEDQESKGEEMGRRVADGKGARREWDANWWISSGPKLHRSFTETNGTRTGSLPCVCVKTVKWKDLLVADVKKIRSGRDIVSKKRLSRTPLLELNFGAKYIGGGPKKTREWHRYREVGRPRGDLGWDAQGTKESGTERALANWGGSQRRVSIWGQSGFRLNAKC